MKKVLSFVTLLFVTLTCLTSCNKDDQIGDTLQGAWEGYMSISDSYGNYRNTYTLIDFEQSYDSWRSGTGYWVDDYGGTRVSSYINWRVSNSTIYITFRDDNTQVEIRNYTLSDNKFMGVIYYRGQSINFNFSRTSYNHQYMTGRSSLFAPKAAEVKTLK